MTELLRHALAAGAQRPAGFMLSTRLRCPYNHRIKKDHFVLGDGGVRCRELVGNTVCGALLYVCAMVAPHELVPATAPDAVRGPKLLFTAAVTYEELREIEQRELTVWEVCEFLGVAFRPTALPLAR